MTKLQPAWHFLSCKRHLAKKLKVIFTKNTTGICLSSQLLPCHPWPEMETQSHEYHLHLQIWRKSGKNKRLDLCVNSDCLRSQLPSKLSYELCFLGYARQYFQQKQLAFWTKRIIYISTAITTFWWWKASPSHCSEKLLKEAEILS